MDVYSVEEIANYAINTFLWIPPLFGAFVYAIGSGYTFLKEKKHGPLEKKINEKGPNKI
jgi:hypothetical protein